ncbi:MAG: C4-dicarboxylate TRAP transporter substrate-binding protein [Burkholderiales bacterium]|nr:C4-dicarboxylate TRAP transporter substrate-binding protein [Burkholderiales bacterium]MCC7115941.1 C4-dicarboxylate TRAP transporter substrate-binding protein [Burkholderiales bacterium]
MTPPRTAAVAVSGDQANATTTMPVVSAGANNAMTQEETTMKRTSPAGWCAMAIGVLAAALALPVAAQQIKIVSGDGPQHDGVKAMQEFAKWLGEKSGGKVTGRVFPQTLLSVKEIPAGLRDGVGDLGLIVHPYHRAEFPEANFIADFSLFAKSNPAAAGAATEYILTCDECMQEMKKQGQVYLGNIANAPYSLLSKKPLRTLADLKGIKVRSGGDAWSRWIEAMGAVSVSIPAAEAYQALSQGVLDAHTHSIGSLVDQSLADVVKNATDMPLGVYLGASMNYSAKNWATLSPEARKVVFDLAPYLLAKYVTNLRVAADTVRGKLGQLKVTLHQPSPELLAANEQFLRKDENTIVELSAKNSGIKNASQKAARFVQLLAKWEKLTAGMPADHQRLGDLYQKEIFSKLDVAKLGQ